MLPCGSEESKGLLRDKANRVRDAAAILLFARLTEHAQVKQPELG